MSEVTVIIYSSESNDSSYNSKSSGKLIVMTVVKVVTVVMYN